MRERHNLNGIDPKMLSDRLEAPGLSEKYFERLMEFIPSSVSSRMLMPSICVSSSSALKLGLDRDMRISHTSAAEILSLSPSEGVDRLWERYLDCYPFPSDRAPGLRIAVQKGLVDVVKRFLGAGADVCAVDERGNTLLHSLGNQFHPEMVPLLISHGAPIRQANGEGNSPLLALVTRGNPLYIRSLIEGGADPFEMVGTRCIFTQNSSLEWTSAVVNVALPQMPLAFLRTCSPEGGHLISYLCDKHRLDAISKLLTNLPGQDWDIGERKLLRRLLSSPSLQSAVIQYASSGSVGARYAGRVLVEVTENLSSRRGSDTEVLKLIQACGNDVNQQGEDSYTPLMRACAAGAFEIVSALLAQGADPCRRGRSGETALLLLASARGWGSSASETAAADLVKSITKSPAATSTLQALDRKSRNAMTLCATVKNFTLFRELLKATQWSVTEPAPLTHLLSETVGRPQAFSEVLTHLKNSLEAKEFESAMRLVLDEKEGRNILEKACSLKIVPSIIKILDLASTAYEKTELVHAREIAGLDWVGART